MISHVVLTNTTNIPTKIPDDEEFYRCNFCTKNNDHENIRQFYSYGGCLHQHQQLSSCKRTKRSFDVVVSAEDLSVTYDHSIQVREEAASAYEEIRTPPFKSSFVQSVTSSSNEGTTRKKTVRFLSGCDDKSSSFCCHDVLPLAIFRYAPNVNEGDASLWWSSDEEEETYNQLIMDCKMLRKNHRDLLKGLIRCYNYNENDSSVLTSNNQNVVHKNSSNKTEDSVETKIANKLFTTWVSSSLNTTASTTVVADHRPLEQNNMAPSSTSSFDGTTTLRGLENMVCKTFTRDRRQAIQSVVECYRNNVSSSACATPMDELVRQKSIRSSQKSCRFAYCMALADAQEVQRFRTN